MISTTMHSSAKKHSVKGKSDLMKIAKHNDRGYLSVSYDKNKIQSVVGDSATIESDTIQFIDKQFEPTIHQYDQKQKRKDRKIGDVSASDYFDQNRQTDLAVEQIFQVADKDFWSRWRKDETRTSSRGKKYSTHTFDSSIIDPMNQLFREMALVVENLYGEDATRERILSKILEAKNKSTAFINSIPKTDRDRFDLILKLKKEEKQQAIALLSKEEQNTIVEYNEAKAELKLIKGKQLIERTENGQMHFKIINVTAHYDEWSPHAHMVGVAWADGFKNGLESKIAKSVYLNKYALEVAQERIHELVEEKIKEPKYQSIFQEEKMKPKEEGRNHDFTPSQIASIKESEKIINQNKNKIKNQSNEIKNKKNAISKLDKSISERKSELNALEHEKTDKVAQISILDAKIKEKEIEYQSIVSKAKNLIEKIKPIERLINIIEAVREFNLMDHIRYALKDVSKRLSDVRYWKDVMENNPKAIEGYNELIDIMNDGIDEKEIEETIQTIKELDEF